jgi:tetratricopeptide (TPR) repeat protein
MARRVLDVFLSSTARDLEPHRAAIHAQLTRTGVFHCVWQEDFGPQNAGAVEFCREKVKASDIFVGLVGQRRGWEPDGDSAMRSITEMEHDWAKEAACRRYLYVAPDDFSVPGNLRDTDEEYARQQTFRKRVMEGAERIVSQKGFGESESFAADVVQHLLTQLVTSDLITQLRPELSPSSQASAEEQRPAIAAAVERLVDDDDVDLLALAKNPKDIDLTELERKLRERAEKHQADAQSSMKASAEYWRHIGALAFLHDTQKAMEAYEKAVALDPDEPEGWRYLGELQYRLGDLAKAEQSFDRVLLLGKLRNDPKAQLIGCLRLGWIWRDRGELERAETLIGDAIQFAEKAGWDEGLARAYGGLGVVHDLRGDLSQAEDAQRKSLSLYEKLHNKDGMARVYGNLGIICRNRGELDHAEEAYRKSMELYEQLGDRDGIARVLCNLAVVHQHRGEFDKAQKSTSKAIALSEELGIKEIMAVGYRNLGSIHHRKGESAAMCECWHKARELYREMGLAKETAQMDRLLKTNKCRV